MVLSILHIYTRNTSINTRDSHTNMNDTIHEENAKYEIPAYSE